MCVCFFKIIHFVVNIIKYATKVDNFPDMLNTILNINFDSCFKNLNTWAIHHRDGLYTTVSPPTLLKMLTL